MRPAFEEDELTMEGIGKVNGKPPVFNDVLAFVHSKIKLCRTNTLLSVISTYYPPEDLEEARDILFALVDPNGHLPRLPTLASAIVFHMSEKYDILDYSFLALDLNHIPSVDLIDDDAVTMFMEKHKVQRQLQEVLAEQAQVKAQLAIITDKLDRIHQAKRSGQQQHTRTSSEMQPTTPQVQKSPPASLPAECPGPVFFHR